MVIESLVSVLIPVYNRVSLVGDTIDSALNQTYDNIEIIIVDNFSNDGTWELLQDYARKDNRIRIYRNEVNIGPVRNWKRCIDEANGEYAKILWSDDLMEKTFIEKSISLFKKHSEIGFVYSKTCIFKETNSIDINLSIFDYFRKSGIYNSRDFINGIFENPTFSGKFPYSPGCALFKSSSLKANLHVNIYNKFNIDFSTEAIGNDLLIFLLTAKTHSKFGYIDENLNFFRSHDGSISSLTTNKLELIYFLSKVIFLQDFKYDLKYTAHKRFNSYLKSALGRDKQFFKVNNLREFYLSSTYKLDYVESFKLYTRNLICNIKKYV